VSGPRRQRQIVELLRDRPFASVRELQEQLGSSSATVRRDIEKVGEAGDIGTMSLRVASAAGAVR
jgi:DeoR family ulaG and ulaABCDEF operon transcriptional repressor